MAHTPVLPLERAHWNIRGQNVSVPATWNRLVMKNRKYLKESFPFRGMIVSFADMTQQPTRGLQYAPGRIPLVVQPQENFDENKA